VWPEPEGKYSITHSFSRYTVTYFTLVPEPLLGVHRAKILTALAVLFALSLCLVYAGGV
jgi:hypothetical protein